MSHAFVKMNGLGNDFVVVEARSSAFEPSPEEVRAIARRDEGGIGCDQLIALTSSPDADAFMRIWNADGGEVSACGNAARCVGWLLMQASGRDQATLATRAGLLRAWAGGPKAVTVDMGPPGLGWRDIPLAEDMDTRGIELQVGPIDAPHLHTPGCVSMGNPHVIFFLADAAKAPVREIGPMIEHHHLFPEGVNVGFAEVQTPERIRYRVWERGAGETKACGTGACAAVVAAHRRGLSERRVTVVLDGGELRIDWREDERPGQPGHVMMSGPIAVEFTGTLP